MENAKQDKKSVDFVLSAVKNPKEKQNPHVLCEVTNAATSRAASLGIVLDGKQVALDHDGSIHTIKTMVAKKKESVGRSQLRPMTWRFWVFCLMPQN